MLKIKNKDNATNLIQKVIPLIHFILVDHWAKLREFTGFRSIQLTSAAIQGKVASASQEWHKEDFTSSGSTIHDDQVSVTSSFIISTI